MNFKALTLLAGLAPALIGGLAQAETVSVETAAGPASVTRNPAPVVALDLAALDALQGLGVPVAAVPKIKAPAYLAETMAKAPTVGTLFEPDFEAIAALAPQLVIAGGRSQAQVPALAKIAPTIDMTIGDGDLTQTAKARVAAYGTIFGKEAEAAAMNASLDAALETARAAVKDKGNALILIASGGKISAFGDDSRFGWMHTALGIPEAFPALKAESHGEAVSFEFVAEVDPDWILVIDRGAAIGAEGEAARATLDTPLVQGTKAGKAGHIVYLDGGPLYLAGGGVGSMKVTLGEITAAFGK